MPVYILLFIALTVLSTVAGIFMWKRRLARRRDFLQRAAQFLGLQFLERFARSHIGPRLTGLFRGTRVSARSSRRPSAGRT